MYHGILIFSRGVDLTQSGIEQIWPWICKPKENIILSTAMRM